MMVIVVRSARELFDEELAARVSRIWFVRLWNQEMKHETHT